MFARISISLLFIAALVAASPSPKKITNITNECNTGPTHCCDVNQTAGSTHASIRALLRRNKVEVGDDNTNIATGCSPIGVLGGGSVQCNSQPVCCTGNTFESDGGVIVGCSSVGGNVGFGGLLGGIL